MQGPYAVLGKSLLSAGRREGAESQVIGKGEGFASCQILDLLPLQEIAGENYCTDFLCNDKAPRDEGILGCGLSLMQS